MATVQDGSNPGRKGHQPARQSPSPARQGRGGSGDPTEQPGQTPPDIFGFAQSYSTGAPGTQGATGSNADVTIQAGQLDEGLSGVTGSEITDTGAPGSAGGHKGAGGDGVRYTDPFGYMGNDHRDSVAANQVGGPSDSTKGIDGFSPGPTFAVLENCRPVDTGAGDGHVRGAGNPNAEGGGTSPRGQYNNPNAGK